MADWKSIGFIVLLSVTFFLDYQYASALYGVKITVLREDYATK